MATSDVSEDGLSPVLVAATASATSAVALVAAAVVVFDDLAFGLAVGALSGLGSYFLVEFLLRGVGDEARDDNVVETFHRGALGFAASGSGVAALALMFVLERPALALAGGLGLATVEYLVLSQVLPREFGDDSEPAS